MPSVALPKLHVTPMMGMGETDFLRSMVAGLKQHPPSMTQWFAALAILGRVTGLDPRPAPPMRLPRPRQTWARMRRSVAKGQRRNSSNDAAENAQAR